MSINKSLLTILLVTGMLFSLRITVFAADATFSKDSTHLYLLQWKQQPPRASGECSLIDVDLEKKTAAAINFSNQTKEHLSDITLSNDGNILCATKTAVWLFDPIKRACEKVIDAPKDVEISAIAYDSSQSVLFSKCYGVKFQELFCLPDGAHDWIPVYNRRPPSVDSPVFADDGSLYFTSTGDLWSGHLKKQTEPTLPALNRYSIQFDRNHWPKSIPVAELEASRFAPVASLETQNTTSDSTGLLEVAVSKRFIYGDYARMGGSGWGAVIRLARSVPSQKEGDKKPHPPGDNGKVSIPVLQSIETVSEEPCHHLCASKDGSLIFYIQHGDTFLIKDEGKPEKLTIDGLSNLL